MTEKKVSYSYKDGHWIVELPVQTTEMNAVIIECALISGGALVIGQAKITVEISLI